MSNRKRARPPKPGAAVDALLANTRCTDCGSTKALRKWDRQRGEWVITPLHAAGCAVRARKVSPHVFSENAVAAARKAGHAVAYVPYSDDTGGVVVGSGSGLS